jgi:hypothetical protein
MQEGVTIGMRGKAAVAAAALGLAADRFTEAPVEALHQAVRLWTERARQAMVDATLGTDAIERVAPRRAIRRFAFHLDGEPVGELAAVVREDGVDGVREVSKEAIQERGGRGGVALVVDLEIDVARRPVDGDERVALAPFERRQILEIDVDEADGGRLECPDGRLFRGGHAVEALARQAAVDGAARQRGINAAAQDLDNVVERQGEAGPQLADQLLFERRQANRQPFGGVGGIGDGRASAPAADRRLTDAELGGELCDGGAALLDVTARLRRGGGVGVQLQLHVARRSLTYERPRATPIPSKLSRVPCLQSPGTEHLRGHDGSKQMHVPKHIEGP